MFTVCTTPAVAGTITTTNLFIFSVKNEIEERTRWLEDMEKLGAAEEHRFLINSQISLKIRDIEFLQEKNS